jgi:hypothetical protein
MMTNSLHDELSTSSPRLNKEEEMLEMISDPKTAVSLMTLSFQDHVYSLKHPLKGSGTHKE